MVAVSSPDPLQQKSTYLNCEVEKAGKGGRGRERKGLALGWPKEILFHFLSPRIDSRSSDKHYNISFSNKQ